MIARFLDAVQIGTTLEWYDARSPVEPADGANPTETVLRRGRVVEINPPLEQGTHLASAMKQPAKAQGPESRMVRPISTAGSQRSRRVLLRLKK